MLRYTKHGDIDFYRNSPDEHKVILRRRELTIVPTFLLYSGRRHETSCLSQRHYQDYRYT